MTSLRASKSKRNWILDFIRISAIRLSIPFAFLGVARTVEAHAGCWDRGLVLFALNVLANRFVFVQFRAFYLRVRSE
jgi:hypothetical protein